MLLSQLGRQGVIEVRRYSIRATDGTSTEETVGDLRQASVKEVYTAQLRQGENCVHILGVISITPQVILMSHCVGKVEGRKISQSAG